MIMYNFGSPRVGNKKFSEVYNEVLFTLCRSEVLMLRLTIFYIAIMVSPFVYDNLLQL